MKPKFKVLLIQLPIPEFKTQKHWGNSPLAAGYLKAAAFTAGLLNDIDIEILNEDDTNLSGDARLIDLIVSKAPDVVGWSLFLWNARRSLYLSSEIKKRCPDTRIVVGGPEVSSETDYVLHYPAVDSGCFGEGETVFVEMLRSFCFGTPDMADLSGIFYKKNQELLVNPGKNYVKNLDQTSSPFLLDYINVKNHPMISYETNRGCPFHCAYCQTATLPFRHFSVERICADIHYFVKERVRKVRLSDSNVALHPDFVKLFTEIKRIVSNRNIGFSGFAYAEHLTEEKVSLLKECNFTFLELGLQTIHQETLKTLRRPKLNKDAFLRGLELLETYEITYHIDTIIGLPGESYSDYKATIDFLNDHHVKYIEAFPLMIMPGTELNNMAESLELKHQNLPPYYLIETDAISRKEIADAKERFHRTPVQPSDIDYTFLSHLSGSIFDINVSDQQEIVSFSEVHAFNKLIVDIKNGYNADGCDRDESGRANVKKALLETIPERKVNAPFTAWFKIQSPEEDFPLIHSFLDRIVSANPFIIMNLIIDAEEPFLPENMEKLTASLQFKEMRLKVTEKQEPFLNHYLLFPWNALQTPPQTKAVQECLKGSNLNASTRVVWSVDISGNMKWEDVMLQIDQICEIVSDPSLLIRFEDGCEKTTVFKILTFLKDLKVKNLYFTNSALYYAMELLRMESENNSSPSKPNQLLQSPVPYENCLTYEHMGQAWRQILPQALKQVKDIGFQMAFRKKFSVN